MRKRIAIGLGIVGLSLGLVNVSPANAQPPDKTTREFIHLICGDPMTQELVAGEFGVQANRGQCMKALREFFGDLET